MQRPDAPVRVSKASGGSSGPRVQQPDLSQDAPVDVNRRTRREITRAVGDEERAERYLQHLTIALAALDERDGGRAAPHLRWLKSKLPRLPMLREALGVALYLDEDYRGALSELNTYRRLSGAEDQNHIIADCLRAIGDADERIPELVAAMDDNDDVGAEARTEGRIVWASWLADAGDLGAARAVLSGLLDERVEQVEEHHLRLWYVAGDLADRAGDSPAALRWFERIAGEAEGFFDTDERLARLR